MNLGNTGEGHTGTTFFSPSALAYLALRTACLRVSPSTAMGRGSSFVIAAPVLCLIRPMRVKRARERSAVLDGFAPTNVRAFALTLPASCGNRQPQRGRLLLCAFQRIRASLGRLDFTSGHLPAVLCQRFPLTHQDTDPFPKPRVPATSLSGSISRALEILTIVSSFGRLTPRSNRR